MRSKLRLRVSCLALLLAYASSAELRGARAQHDPAPWQMQPGFVTRGRRLFRAVRGCDAGPPCLRDELELMGVLAFFTVGITVVLCLYAVLSTERDDTTDPLCPQFVATQSDVYLSCPAIDSSKLSEEGTSLDVLLGGRQCTAILECRTDPERQHGLSNTLRLYYPQDVLVASVLVKSVSMPHSITLIRCGRDIFGAIEYDPAKGQSAERYTVRYRRSGATLMTLVGDFKSLSYIEGAHPSGTVLCQFQRNESTIEGHVRHHFDAGLAFCSLMGIVLHQRALVNARMDHDFFPGQPGQPGQPEPPEHPEHPEHSEHPEQRERGCSGNSATDAVSGDPLLQLPKEAIEPYLAALGDAASGNGGRTP